MPSSHTERAMLNSFLVTTMTLLLTTFFASTILLPDSYGQVGRYLNLSGNPGNSTFPSLAISGNNVYVAWTDNTTGNGDVYLKRSVDNGTTFGSLESISSNPGKSLDPEIAVSQDKLYIVWTDKTTGNGDIYFKASLDKGVTFSNFENLSNNTGSSVSPQVAVSGNNVYVAWTDNTTGNGDVYFKASLDNGLKFKGKKILGKNIGNSLDPQIAVSENNAVVFGIWRDNTQYDPAQNATSPNFDLLFRTSSNGGGNFTDRNTVGKTVGDFADYAQIVIPAGKSDASIVWSDIYRYREPATYDLFFQSITNNGSTLNDPINLSNNEGNSTIPKIAISKNGTTHVVWTDSTTGNGDIYYSRVH